MCGTLGLNIHIKRAIITETKIFLLTCYLRFLWFNLNLAQNTGVYNSSGFSCSLEASYSLESNALTTFSLFGSL